MRKKKTTLMSLALACVVGLAGCGKAETTEPLVVQGVELSSQPASGSGYSAYLLGDGVCDVNGRELSGLSVDAEGNIVDASGAIVVAAEFAEEFSCPTGISVPDKAQLSIALDAVPSDDNSLDISPTTFCVTIQTDPADTANSIVILESSAPEMLYFGPQDNAAIMAGISSVEEVASGSMGTLALTVDSAGRADVYMTATFRGDVEITAYNVLGQQIGSFTASMSISTEKADAEKAAKIAACDHEFEFVQDWPANCEDEGYSIYVCPKCGAEEHRDPVPAIGHNFKTVVYEHIISYDEATGAVESDLREGTFCMNCGLMYEDYLAGE